VNPAAVQWPPECSCPCHKQEGLTHAVPCCATGWNADMKRDFIENAAKNAGAPAKSGR